MKKTISIILATCFLTQNAFSRSGRENEKLMKAVISGKISEVKKLIEKGADVNFLGQCDQPFVNYKCTALYSAIHAGNFDIAKLLLEEGSDPNILNSKKQETALMEAVKQLNEELVGLLINANSSVNVQDNTGATALILSAWKGNLEIIKKLVGAGSLVNTADNKGQTALMDASENGHTNIVGGLVALGGNVNAKNNEGKTAYELALRKGNKDIYAFLQRLMSNINDIKEANNRVAKEIAQVNAEKAEALRRENAIIERNRENRRDARELVRENRDRNWGVREGDPLGDFLAGLSNAADSWNNAYNRATNPYPIYPGVIGDNGYNNGDNNNEDPTPEVDPAPVVEPTPVVVEPTPVPEPPRYRPTPVDPTPARPCKPSSPSSPESAKGGTGYSLLGSHNGVKFSWKNHASPGGDGYYNVPLIQLENTTGCTLEVHYHATYKCPNGGRDGTGMSGGSMNFIRGHSFINGELQGMWDRVCNDEKPLQIILKDIKVDEVPYNGEMSSFYNYGGYY